MKRTQLQARPPVVIIGPLPPPHHGVATWTRLIVESDELNRRFDLHHIDTTDPRAKGNMGRFDAENVRLGIRHIVACARLVARLPRPVVCIAVSQGLAGLLRDWLLLSVSRAAGGRVVTILHGGGYLLFYDRSPFLVRALLRDCIRRATINVVLGPSLVGMPRSIVPAAAVAIVPNGSCGIAREAPGEGGGKRLRVLFLSSLRRSKGFDLFLESARLARDGGLPMTFTAAGEWDTDEFCEEMESFVREHDLTDTVSLIGPVDGERKARVLRDADVFVLPSDSEGHPYVVLEAMSVGCPVIATNTGAVGDTVVNGVTGFLVPYRDPVAILDRLGRFARDPMLGRRMGAAAYERYAAEFTVERSHEALAGVFTAAWKGGR